MIFVTSTSYFGIWSRNWLNNLHKPVCGQKINLFEWFNNHMNDVSQDALLKLRVELQYHQLSMGQVLKSLK